MKSRILVVALLALLALAMVCLTTAVRADVLLAQWNFTDDANFAKDSSGNGHDLLIGTNVSHAPGGGALFDPSDTDPITGETHAAIQTVDAINMTPYKIITVTWTQNYADGVAGMAFETGPSFSNVGPAGAIVAYTTAGTDPVNDWNEADLDLIPATANNSANGWLAGSGPQTLSVKFDLTKPDNEVISVYNGATLIAQTNTFDTTLPPGLTFTNQTFNIGDRFAEMVDGLPLGYAAPAGIISNVSIRGEVPEPGTIALLAGGLIGLLCYAWRKR